jgi:hypothetical protein
LKLTTKAPNLKRLAVVIAAAIAIAGGAAYHLKPAVAVHAQDNLTPGMLFGPMWLDNNQHLELCFSYLSPGSITALVHFRNFTTGEVTSAESITLNSGGGGCATYSGRGRIVGMARGDGAAADWVSPSNALISTMSIVDDGSRNTRAVVLGVAKMWVRGL